MPERELGEIFARLNACEHRSRNDRQALSLLEAELDRLQSTVERLTARIYASLAVLSAVASLAIWGIELWL